MLEHVDVSIIVPVFNGEKTIGLLLEKLLKETRVKFEIIVINDGSTDGTAKLLNSIKDPRLVKIEQKNKGVYACRNEGLKLHKGKWLIFPDADNDICENFIFTRFNLAKKTNADVLICNAWYNYSDNYNIPVHTEQSYNIMISGFSWIKNCVTEKEWPHYLWLQIIYSDYIKKNNISFHKGKSHNDILWTVELALCNGNFFIVNEKDYFYAVNEISITHRSDYYDIRAKSHIDIICTLIQHSLNPDYSKVKYHLLNHALTEYRHFIGLYRKKISDRNSIKKEFKAKIRLMELMKGVSNLREFTFFLKLLYKLI